MLSFCHVTLRARRPLPPGYPTALTTVGDHLRKRRLDLGLSFKQAAARLGVHFTTLMNWELRQREPAARFTPAVVRFLGYDPTNPDK